MSNNVEQLNLPPFRELFGDLSQSKPHKVITPTASENQFPPPKNINERDFQPGAQPSRLVTSTRTSASGKIEMVGRWTPEEHQSFLQGIMLYGKDWKKIQPLVKTRTLVQIRTHAQKLFKKIINNKTSLTHEAEITVSKLKKSGVNFNSIGEGDLKDLIRSNMNAEADEHDEDSISKEGSDDESHATLESSHKKTNIIQIPHEFPPIDFTNTATNNVQRQSSRSKSDLSPNRKKSRSGPSPSGIGGSFYHPIPFHEQINLSALPPLSTQSGINAQSLAIQAQDSYNSAVATQSHLLAEFSAHQQLVTQQQVGIAQQLTIPGLPPSVHMALQQQQAQLLNMSYILAAEYQSQMRALSQVLAHRQQVLMQALMAAGITAPVSSTAPQQQSTSQPVSQPTRPDNSRQ